MKKIREIVIKGNINLEQMAQNNEMSEIRDRLQEVSIKLQAGEEKQKI